jgi:hypothetical protein
MNPDVIAAVVVPISMCATIVAVVVLVLRHRRSGNRSIEDPAAATVVEQRLARVEVALDEVTTELARLTDGQRFLTKVLTERAADAPVIPSRP